MKILICVLALCLCCVRAPDHIYVYGSRSEKPTREIDVLVDVNFSSKEKASIQAAIELWDNAFNGHVVMTVTSTQFDMDMAELDKALSLDSFLILRVDSSHPYVSSDPSNGRTLGWANGIGGNYIFLVHDRIPEKAIKSISAHELGHLLGAGHGGTFMMQAYYDSSVDYDCVDAWTARQVQLAQHLSEFSITYCDK